MKSSQAHQPLVALTDEERAWLREHPVITLAHDPAWPPIEFSNDRGEISGMAGDYLSLVEERLGVKFVRIPGLTWQEAFARQKRWEIDVATCVARTVEREGFWAFTKPYLTVPIVIATQSNVTYIGGLKELVGKKVALVEGYAIDDWITKDFPEIDLIRVKDPTQGLALLQRGDAFAYLDNLLIIGDYQAKMKISNIKIAGQTPYVNAQRMAVRKDWAPLAGILDKALDSITEAEREQIQREWLPLRYEHGFDYTLLWQALGTFAAILLLLILWNRKLAEEIGRRQVAEAALRVGEARYRTLFETMAQGVVYQSADGAITSANPAAQRILGLSLDQLQGRTSMDPGWHTLREDGTDLPGSEHPAMLALRSGESCDGVMGVFNPGEGSHRWLQVHATPQIPPDGDRPDAVVTTFEDISARRQAEDKLRHITRQDQEALRIARMGHWELDLVSGVFTFNDQYLSLHGLTAQAAGGYRMSAEEFARNYVHPDDAHLVSEHVRQATETTDPGFEIRTEARLLRADGAVRDMIVWFRIEKDAQGRTVKLHGVNQDITERKRAEEALRQANLVVENSPVMLFRWKAVEGWPVVFVSHNVRQLGYAPDEFLDGSVPFVSLVHPEDLERVAQEVQAYSSGGGNQFQQEYRILTRDKTVRWVDDRTVIERDAAGHITHYQGIVIDITERKATESLLRESEERLRQAIRVSEIGIFDHDHRRGVIYWSSNLRAMSGWPPDADMDLPAFMALVHPDDRESVAAAIRHSHDPASDGQYAAEYRIVTDKGSVRWLTERGQTFFEGDGGARQPVRTVGASVDITERKAAEETLRTLNATLEARVKAELARNREKDHLLIQQSRLAAMGEMIGNIAHQWRQPINALSLLLSNLKDAQEFGDLSPDYLIAQVNRGHGLIQGMSSTIDDFRNFFRPNREPQAFGLAAAVRDALAIVESAFAHRHIDIEVEVLRDATLLGFSNEYSQVLLNLLTNAKEAIEARNIAPGRVRIEVDSDEHKARVVVQDNGGGIPAEVLPRIFDPYFTTRDQGTGIGLYMSKMIIESSMRGRIEVANAGDGARISIVTPVSPITSTTQDD